MRPIPQPGWEQLFRARFVRFTKDGNPLILPPFYPERPRPVEQFAGCALPHPDLDGEIRRNRQAHLDHHGDTPPHTIDDLSAAWANRDPPVDGKDILILSSGPSLGEKLKAIMRWVDQTQATVIAINGAAKVFPQYDAVFVQERQTRPDWLEHLRPEQPVICTPATHPCVLEKFKESLCYFLDPWTCFDSWPELPTTGPQSWPLRAPCLPGCLHTLSMALAFAAQLRPARIILVGCDHAFRVDEIAHAQNATAWYFDEQPWPTETRETPAAVPGINGRMCAVTPTQEEMADVTMACIEQIHFASGRRIQIINAGGHGLVNLGRENNQSAFFFSELKSTADADAESKKQRLTRRFLDGNEQRQARRFISGEGSEPARQQGSDGGAGNRGPQITDLHGHCVRIPIDQETARASRGDCREDRTEGDAGKHDPRDRVHRAGGDRGRAAGGADAARDRVEGAYAARVVQQIRRAGQSIPIDGAEVGVAVGGIAKDPGIRREPAQGQRESREQRVESRTETAGESMAEMIAAGRDPCSQPSE